MRPFPGESPRAPEPVPLAWLDVAGAATLCVAAAWAASALPAGPLRLALTLPVLLFAPGYLLLQAFVVPPARGTARAWQCLVAIGLSPALVGLLALSTSIVEGGFRPTAIVATVTAGSLALGALALVRRRRMPQAAPHHRPAPHRAGRVADLQPRRRADAATAKTGPLRP